MRRHQGFALASLIPAVLTFGAVRPASAAPAVKFVLTDTFDASKTCKAANVGSGPGEDFGTLRCRGAAGYKLNVLYDDSRDDVSLVDPKGKETSLRLSEVIGNSFASLGKTAEWRVVGSKAVAVTVRFIISDPENDTKKTSYLVVARLTPDPCVVAKIAPAATQSATARTVASRAATMSCLSPQN